jgi:hypothetical protein
MDDQKQAEAYKTGMESDLKALSKLRKIDQSQEFNDYFDLILDTAAKKMFTAFVGDNVKTWDDFLKVRGEVVAYLFPIQEVRGADAMEKQIKEQLNSYYGKNL